MRLIAYVRVSTDDQAKDGHSLTQQPARLAAFCTLHEHQLVRVIADEGVSASIPLARRPGGAELIRALRAGEAEGVVVVRLDRLFRDATDGMIFFNRTFRRNAVNVCSISENIDTSTPAGKLALGLQLITAQYERDLAVQRATECNTALRGAGRVYGGVPYGCIERAGRLFRDPITWRWREMIVAQIRSSISLRMVQANLADHGVRSPTGKTRWAINTLWNLPTHHDDLAQLPFATQPAAVETTLPDPGVSHAPLH
jgi:DNA invertase Pin-like site-specific DNA recombinase